MTISTEMINRRVSSVIDTLKFQGVEIVNINLEDDIFEFDVLIDKKKRSKDIEFVLNFTYWTLWTLVYGKRSETNRDSFIKLNYKEVE